jgi:hypothetical protein
MISFNTKHGVYSLGVILYLRYFMVPHSSFKMSHPRERRRVVVLAWSVSRVDGFLAIGSRL